MATIMLNRIEMQEYETQMNEFNDFLKNNMDFIKQIVTTNPSISKDDEWRTDDYSKYDEIRKNVK